ncbi:transporter substrate-binding domain-containing protein [Alkalihalobacillus deserti]|uniref:transporter substrate-binding domain-containing protein n=1 Tax=Alkalihalobacillus deserti TaxID=2879466 RepID=UPI001D13B622|nr:transporter substrate-binding domain-containing protein [Alkalihalobacillus deserti]
MKKVILVLAVSLLLTFLGTTVNADEATILVVGYDPNLPPINFTEDGVPAGFAVDMMNEIAVRMGTEIKYIPIPQKEAITKLQYQQIDLLLSAHFNEKHARVMDFSDSILGTSIGLLVHEKNNEIKGLAQLTNAVTALQSDTIEYEFLRNIRRIKYHVASNQVTALDLLFKGRANAFVGNVITAQYVLEQTGRQDDYQIVGNYLLPIDYTMAVKKENYLLLSQLNRAIREIKSDGTYSALYEKWFDWGNDLTDRLWLVIQIIGSLLFLAIIFSFIGLRWNRQLQREVSKKTNGLNQINYQLQEKIAQMKNSDEFQKQILNSSPRGIVTVNQDGLITSFNTKAIEISGEPDPVVGLHYEQVLLLQKLLEGRFAQVFQTKNLFLGEESVWERDEHRTFYLRYYVYPLFDFKKRLNGLIVTFEDITEERKLRLQIFEQEKNKALGRVVAGIAHEIRNPLTSIKTFAELIPRKYNNERFQKEISTYVPQEIERVNQLIEGLIDYAKPKQLNKERIDVSLITKECTILFERTALNKGISLVSETEDELWIEADSNQLKQVIINLIINSLDAIDTNDEVEDRIVKLKAYSKDNGIVMKVSDKGAGMDETEQLQALEPFYTTKEKGTGLGLAIANQYVHENKGRLEIDSKKGKGTTITLTFSPKNGG